MKLLYTLLVFLLDKVKGLGNILYTASKYLLLTIALSIVVIAVFCGIGYLSSLFNFTFISAYVDSAGGFLFSMIYYFACGGVTIITLTFSGVVLALVLWGIKLVLTDVLIGGTTQLIYGIACACESGWKIAKRQADMKFSPYKSFKI